MIQLSTFLWGMVLLFALIGFSRGWTKEVIALTGIVLALFTLEQFKEYMFRQSQPLDDNIEVFREIAEANELRVGSINNEGRELAIHRIREFHLTELFDFFVTSSFVHFRKPDADIFRLALDIAQVPPEQAVYVEDRLMFVEIARELGIHSVHHESLDKTLGELADMGLKLPPSREHSHDRARIPFHVAGG